MVPLHPQHRNEIGHDDQARRQWEFVESVCCLLELLVPPPSPSSLVRETILASVSSSSNIFKQSVLILPPTGSFITRKQLPLI